MPYPPKNTTLNHRHMIVAQFFAMGRTITEIEKITGYGIAYLSALSKWPPLKKEIARMQEDLKTQTFSEFMQRIDAERMPTLEKLVELRDHGDKDDSVQLNAAKALLDYDPVLATELNKATADPNDYLRVSFPKGSLRMMMVAMAEEDGRPVPALDAIDVTPEPEVTKLEVGGLRAKSPEEFEKEFDVEDF